MIYCIHCGGTVSSENGLCTKCGASAASAPPAAPPAPAVSQVQNVHQSVNVQIARPDSIVFAVITLICWVLFPPLGLLLNIIGLITGPKRGCFFAMMLPMFAIGYLIAVAVFKFSF